MSLSSPPLTADPYWVNKDKIGIDQSFRDNYKKVNELCSQCRQIVGYDNRISERFETG